MTMSVRHMLVVGFDKPKISSRRTAAFPDSAIDIWIIHLPERCLKNADFSFIKSASDTWRFDSSRAERLGFLAVNNTWHFFVPSLDVWSLTMYRDAMQSPKPCHRPDPHRDELLTLTAQSKGQSDVTGIWAGNRDRGSGGGWGSTKLPKNTNKNC